MNWRFVCRIIFHGEQRRQRSRQPVLRLIQLRHQVRGRHPRLGRGGDLLLQLAHFHLQRSRLRRPRLLLGFGREDQIVRLQRREERLHPVIIALPEAVELMVMAARAAQRDAQNAGAHDVRHLRKLLVAAARYQLVAGIAPHRAQTIKPRRDQRFLFRGRDLIARDLFLHKPVERLVIIKCADHIVAIAPRVRTEVIVLITFRLREPHHIQPVLAPVLPVMRTGEQTLHHLFPRLR